MTIPAAPVDLDRVVFRFHRPARIGVVISTPAVAAVMVWVEADTCLHEMTLLARLAGPEGYVAAYLPGFGVWTWAGDAALRRERRAA